VVVELIILARHSDRPAAFHREIVHNEFEDNPRFSGGIEMPAIERISKQFSLAWDSGLIAKLSKNLV
jgi:hypothetical protein